MASLQSLDIKRYSATTTATPSVRESVEVAKLIDVSRCIGCKACQAACLEWNDLRDEVGVNVGVYENPHDLTDATWTLMRFSEVEEPDGHLEWLIRKDGCMHCEDPGCLKACPAPGAIVQYANGIVDVNPDACIGCKYCETGCPFNVPKFSSKTGKMAKCTLCVDRTSVGLEPACVKACPTGCLHYGTKDDMLTLAKGRVAQLKANGFANAAVYDPPGVGGTGVITVLAHGDHPEWYGGLPADPRVPWIVTLGKNVLRPLGMLGIVAAIVGAFGHHLWKGSKEPPEDQSPEVTS